MPHLAFVMSRHQNLFFLELVEAIGAELSALGVSHSVHTDGFPAPEPELVYALVPPHEYFLIEDESPQELSPLLARSVFICAEQPGTSHFEDNVALAPYASAVFDINPWAISEFHRRGVPARHFQVGYTSAWDTKGEGPERDLDVLFMGAYSPRRSRFLASYADSLWRWRTRLVLSDNSGPNWAASERFLVGEEKWRLLRRSRVLLNLHQGELPYFEWLRIVQAIQSRTAVVSEHSIDFEPLMVGTHLLAAAPENLMLLAPSLLEDEDRRSRMTADAAAFLREELPMRRSVAALVEAATEAARAPVPAGNPARSRATRTPAVVEQAADFSPQSLTDDPGLSLMRVALKDIRLDLLDMRREIAAIKAGAQGPEVIVDRRSRAYRTARPRVSVLLSLFNYGRLVGSALDSLADSDFRSLEVIVVDDGSSDDSLRRVRTWIAEHEHVPAILIRHTLNRGLGQARNTALGFARGDLCFILDADNRVFPPGLTLLVNALDADHEAAFAYGMLQRVNGDGSSELMDCWPWEPARLRGGNYIDAMAMIRTDALREGGGYTTDRRLYGWEDYDLWCRLAEEGRAGILVPELVAHYRASAHSMLTLTNISGTVAHSVLAERYPNLMAGVKPPL